MREGKFLVDRADVDDLSAGLRRHAILNKGLRDEKQPFQVDVEHGVEIRFRGMPEVGAALESSVIDEDVDFAELSRGIRDKFLSVVDAADVVLKSGDLAPGLRNICHRSVGACLI